MKKQKSNLAILILILSMLFQTVSLKANEQQKSLGLKWEVGNMSGKDARPSNYFDATVPGAVQLDFMKANKLEHFSIGTHAEDYKHLEDDFWCYKTTFVRPELNENQNLVFISLGIDYEFDILLNGKMLFHQEGMFTPVRLVLNDKLIDENTLEVIIYPIPIAVDQSEGRRQAILATKPPVPYGWDWHPRLVPVGIWDKTVIKVENKAKILENDFTYKLTEDLSKADITFSFRTSTEAKELSYQWQLLNASGAQVLNEVGKIADEVQTSKVQLKNPELWWTFDHGNPYLYNTTLTIMDSKGNVLDKRTSKVGFRKVELVMHEGAWLEPMDFPKTRNTPPFTLRLNNRVVYAKGSNWVHPEIFYGTITHERYLEQLILTKELNMNILRIWGGGITNKESFFEICDSLGIMIWQEFPLACNPYPNDPHYLEILEQEAISIIKKVRQHPSLSIWSGGNELFNSWSGMTEQSYALRLLNSLCYRIDPHTPYINTSPIYGVGHGHYLFYDWDDNLDVFQRMSKARNTAYTEFGMPSLAPLDVLKKIIPLDEQFPVKPTPSWKIHGAFEAWKSTSWGEFETIEKYFGQAKDLEELVWQSQTLQSIGYKAIFEEGRRQKPKCSMVLNWCLNEPWPTAANNSIIAYPNIKKPSFEAVKASLRPVLASAAFSRFVWTAGQQLQFDLWMMNDTYKLIEEGQVEVYITTNGKKNKIGTWEYGNLSSNKNLQGPTIRYNIPADVTSQLVKISVEVKSKPQYNSEYFILIQSLKKEVINVNRLNF